MSIAAGQVLSERYRLIRPVGQGAQAAVWVAEHLALGTHVAAPYTVGPDKVNVVANEVLEGLTAGGLHNSRVGLEGKRLEVGGVTYFVLTSYSVPSS